MRVYRIGKAIYAHDLSGKGAELVGGRWNSKGFSMVYTSESRALCTLEVAVHLPLGIIPKDYQLSIIEIPDEIKILEIKKNQLSSGLEIDTTFAFYTGYRKSIFTTTKICCFKSAFSHY